MLLYYLTLPFLYVLAWLPFPLLYRVSDLCFLLLYYIVGYRKKVVRENLRNAFPEKAEKEIQRLSRKFYRYFCDLLLETLKTLTISPRQLKKRLNFNTGSVFQKYTDEGRSVIIVMGHWGNWELAGARFSMENWHQLYVIYHPLKNPWFNSLIVHMRTRLGTKLFPMQNVARGMLQHRKELTATAFIADQTPLPERAYWTTFLHQDTPFFTGTGKLAKKFNYPVVYVGVKRVGRGRYEIYDELLVENPAGISQEEILELFIHRLEKDIHDQPEIWLWSHRRWKHKRVEG